MTMGFDYRQLTAAHVKAARGLLEWSQDDLVNASGLSKRSIQNIEANIKVADRTYRDVFKAFTNEGMEFYNGDSPGVRLFKQN